MISIKITFKILNVVIYINIVSQYCFEKKQLYHINKGELVNHENEEFIKSDSFFQIPSL